MIKKFLNKKKELKIWHIIIIIIITAIIFNVPGEEKIIEKEIVKEIPVEKIIEKDCSVEESNIEIYKKVLEVDGQAFLIAGESIALISPIAEAAMVYDVTEIERNTAILQENNKKLNELVAEKNILLSQLK